MKIEYDKDVDAAYVYLVDPLHDCEVKSTIEINENIILDFDGEKKLIGIEILNASQVMKEKSLLTTESV